MAKVLEARPEGEVSIETGVGWIDKIEPPKGRNAHVIIRAEHLRIEVKGWCDTTDTDLWTRVQEAHAAGARVTYRVVVKRRRGVDAAIPFADLPRDDKMRDLEDLRPFTGDAAPPAAASGPAQAAPGPVEAPAAPPAPKLTPATICAVCDRPAGNLPTRVLDGRPQHVACPGMPATADDEALPTTPAEAGAGEVAAPPQGRVVDGRRGPRIQEAKPWEPYNSDGSLNLGSYAFTAAEGQVLLAHELLLARADAVAKAEGHPFAPPTEGQIRGLARRLLQAADRTQAAVRTDHHAMRMDASHSRARSAVRTALEVHPVPWGAAGDELDRWVEDLAAYAAILLQVSVSLVDREPLPGEAGR